MLDGCHPDREKFWKAMHERFARLRANRAAWSEHQDEAALWDSVSGDGLEDEEPYFTEETTDDAPVIESVERGSRSSIQVAITRPARIQPQLQPPA